MVSLTYIKRINKYRAHYFGRKPILCKYLAVRPSHVLKYMLATLQLMIPSYRLIPERSVPIYVCHICNNEIMINKVWRTNTSIFLTFELRYVISMMSEDSRSKLIIFEVPFSIIRMFVCVFIE